MTLSGVESMDAPAPNTLAHVELKKLLKGVDLKTIPVEEIKRLIRMSYQGADLRHKPSQK